MLSLYVLSVSVGWDTNTVSVYVSVSVDWGTNTVSVCLVSLC